MTRFDSAKLLETLKVLRAFSMPDTEMLQSLRSNTTALNKLLKEIHTTQEHLTKLGHTLDSVLHPDHMFELTDPKAIAEFTAHKLERRPRVALSTITPMYGSGVYAIYYNGNFSAYEAITGTECPIYVGSSVPENATAKQPKDQGKKLFARIQEHLDSITEAKNLRIEDFEVRFLVVQSGLEKAAEEFLIRNYMPVWNKESKVCSGIGKHGDKWKEEETKADPSGRKEKSKWDVLHPGRPWAANQISRSGMTPEIVEAAINDHFRKLLAKDPDKWQKIFNPAWLAKQQQLPPTQ